MKEYSDFSSGQIDEVIAPYPLFPILQNALLQPNAGFSTIMNALLYLIIIPFLVFFFLKIKIFYKNIKNFLPKKRYLLSKIWNDLNLQLYGYLRGKGLEMLIVALVTALFFIPRELITQ